MLLRFILTLRSALMKADERRFIATPVSVIRFGLPMSASSGHKSESFTQISAIRAGTEHASFSDF